MLKKILNKKIQISKQSLLVALLLGIIFIFGTALRVWRLDQAPKGALVDELHFGYLAYSLIHTGADEHGNKWPLIFTGFGDSKLPAMAYLDIPSVALFGLTVTAIRIPSAIAGSLLIFAAYWLLLEITKRKKWALLGAFITAISPWSFFLSRFGFESNLALLGLTAGLASMFAFERTKKNAFIVFTAFSFATTWYSYIAYRPITVLLLLVFILSTYIGTFKQNKKTIALWLIAFAFFVAPLFSPSSIAVNSTRFDQVGITTETGTESIINEKRTFCSNTFPRTLCDIAWNKPVYIFKELTHRYLSAYSPQFLVTRGELSTDFLTIDSFGQFFPPLYILFILGIGGILFTKNTTLTKTQKWIILVGLLISPVPAALVGEPQKVRLSALFPFLLIVIVYGAVVIDTFLQKKVLQHLFLIGMCGMLLGYTFLYQMEYHGVHMTQHEFKYQSYLPRLHKYLGKFPKDTLINIVPFYSDPLMFHAFYTKMDPAEYQKLAVLDSADGANFTHTIGLGNITSMKYSPEEFSCLGLEKNARVLYVTNVKNENLRVIRTEKSTNLVHTYVYTYDVTDYMLKEDCANREIK